MLLVHRYFVLFCFMLFLLASTRYTYSADRHQFTYQGQQLETVLLENLLTETRYREEQVPDTCYNQVPYQEEVCGNVTRYRDECYPVPGYEDCQNIPDRECRNITRYREECHAGPSRRICRPGPDEQDCRQGPDRQVCRDIPSSQECRQGPDRQECRQGDPRRICRPGPTRQECNQTPSRQDCHAGPSREVCENKPGRRECKPGRASEVCEQTPDTEECTNVPREQCSDVNGRRICRRIMERECRKVPGRRVCRSVPGEEVCRDIPGERVCRNIPGEQICRTIPGERQCRDVPGEPICHVEPGQQICRSVPGEQICRHIPGRQECQTIPGEQHCRTIPGREICEQVPGTPICRQVAYEDQECRDITRRECRWIPPTQQCSRIPYDEYICRMETRYRQEPYACTRTISVPYTVTLKQLKADLEFLFQSDAADIKVDFNVSLTTNGDLQLAAKQVGASHALIIADKKIERQDDGRNLDIKGQYRVRFHDMAIFAPVAKPITNLKLKKDHLTFEIGQVKYPEILRLKLFLANKKNILIDRPLAISEINISDVQNGSRIVVPLKKLGVELKLLKKYDVKIELGVDFAGEVLNHPRPSKTQNLSVSKRRW